MDQVIERNFPATPDSVAEARLCLEELGGLSKAKLADAQILVGELVTNSIRHARLKPGNTVNLKVILSGRLLKAEVFDPGPSFEAPEDESEFERWSGGGLRAVDRVSLRWGTSYTGGGKRVWFELGLGETSGAEPAQVPAGPRSFSTRVRIASQTPVVETQGAVDLASHLRFMEAIEEATSKSDEEAGAIIIDLSEADFFDSVGVGVLLGSTRTLRQNGGKVHLVAQKGPCLRLVRVLELGKFFEIHTQRASAIQAASKS